MRKLTRLDLIRARRDSNQIYYRVNKSSPLFVDIHSLVIKTIGLADILKDALENKRVHLIFYEPVERDHLNKDTLDFYIR